MDAVDAEEYIIFLTGKGNFREEVATILPYKGNRDSSHKPVHYEAIKEFLVKKYKAQVIEGMEADDAMAIMQYEDPENTVICSIDKDLLMVPGKHYNWRKQEHKEVSALEGARWFWTQMLTGDSTDNILGCGTKKPGVYKSGKKKGESYEKRSGIGPKAAEKLLEGATSYDQMKAIVGMQYATLDEGAAFSDPESVMLENGLLLWMKRTEEEDWSFNLEWDVDNEH